METRRPKARKSGKSGVPTEDRMSTPEIVAWPLGREAVNGQATFEMSSTHGRGAARRVLRKGTVKKDRTRATNSGEARGVLNRSTSRKAIPSRRTEKMSSLNAADTEVRNSCSRPNMKEESESIMATMSTETFKNI